MTSAAIDRRVTEIVKLIGETWANIRGTGPSGDIRYYIRVDTDGTVSTGRYLGNCLFLGEREFFGRTPHELTLNVGQTPDLTDGPEDAIIDDLVYSRENVLRDQRWSRPKPGAIGEPYADFYVDFIDDDRQIYEESIQETVADWAQDNLRGVKDKCK